MTAFLFDASAIMVIAKKHGEKASKILEGGAMLDLTLYELGNAIWKIYKLIEKSGKSNALDAAHQAYYLIDIMRVLRVEGQEGFMNTMKVALDGGLSYYDAAYLHVAARDGLTLVTEDHVLLKRAGEVGVTCLQASKADPEKYTQM